MKRSFKKGTIIVIAIMVLLSSMSIAFASEQPVPVSIRTHSITPSWIGVSIISDSFQILSGGISNPKIWGNTHPGAVDYVNVKVSLKRSNGTGWITIKSWNQNIATPFDMFLFNETYNVTSGYSYMYSAIINSYKYGLLLDSVSFDSIVLRY